MLSHGPDEKYRELLSRNGWLSLFAAVGIAFLIAISATASSSWIPYLPLVGLGYLAVRNSVWAVQRHLEGGSFSDPGIDPPPERRAVSRPIGR